MTILERIAELAEPLRAPTFVKAAEFILSCANPVIIETGSFRGETGDGQSTVILALLAQESVGIFFSHELNAEHITKAKDWLTKQGFPDITTFVAGDSIQTLKLLPEPVSFAYLDSYDFEEDKALVSQIHQLKEAMILLPKMAPRSAFLLDDCDLTLGGKGHLSAIWLLHKGYKEVATQYQRLFVRET